MSFPSMATYTGQINCTGIAIVAEEAYIHPILNNYCKQMEILAL